MKPETVIDDFDPETIETYIGMIVVNDKKIFRQWLMH